jgi:hypothetical protein
MLCDDIRIAVWPNLFEYRKQNKKKLRNISSKIPSSIRLVLLKSYISELVSRACNACL